MPVVFGEEGVALEPGRIYVAPPDHHMLLEAPGRIRVVRGEPVHNTRPAVDPLFTSAAPPRADADAEVIERHDRD
jgi:two-component system chemotaxis response regulator CheB